ncbi:microtubule-associated protein Jupiter-like isoform X2 [Anopheles albimanus]|uniref:microtubule-associated protein Jupiter-like isoform X2 n=1 Tax=Anopheles albimanus TaxID=7167 RepID=UPI00163FB882|nr:microtubule-associated protein Jupiter-like isoform X2 [Anopheles albimanus]
MTSTNFTVGFGENSKSSSKVLKPPGGGSSDLFGSEQLSAAQIPRTMSKNRMQSNIFAAPSSSEAHKNVFRQGVHRYYLFGSETPRRAATGQDSHNRLFGEVDRPFTPSKNHMKSNLPIGGDQADGRKQQQNGKSNGVAHQNGNGTANGHHTNGHSNGNGNISSASSDNGSSHNFLRRLSNEDASPDSAYSSQADQSTQQQQQQEQQTHQHHVPLHLQSMAGPGGIWAPRDPSGADPAVPLSPRRQPYFYPSGESLNPTYASHINLCISDDIIISVTEHDGEAPAGAYQLPSPHGKRHLGRFEGAYFPSGSSTSNMFRPRRSTRLILSYFGSLAHYDSIFATNWPLELAHWPRFLF